MIAASFFNHIWVTSWWFPAGFPGQKDSTCLSCQKSGDLSLDFCESHRDGGWWQEECRVWSQMPWCPLGRSLKPLLTSSASLSTWPSSVFTLRMWAHPNTNFLIPVTLPAATGKKPSTSHCYRGCCLLSSAPWLQQGFPDHLKILLPASVISSHYPQWAANFNVHSSSEFPLVLLHFW